MGKQIAGVLTKGMSASFQMPSNISTKHLNQDKMNKWIDITDKRKPKHREVVIVYVPDFCPTGLTIAEYNPITKSFEDDQYGMVTEWVKKWQRIYPPKLS